MSEPTNDRDQGLRDAGADNARPAAEHEEQAAINRIKLRHIIYGSLVSTGAMTLGAWNAQAHGNRSSHDTAQILWGVDRYIVNRELLLAPTAPTTLRLNDIILRLDRLRLPSTGQLTPLPAGTASPALRDSLEAPRINPALTPRAGSVSIEKVQADIRNLEAERAALEAQLQLTPTTKRVLGLLSQGKKKEAVGAIEERADAPAVLGAYVFAQLDLHNLSFVNGKSTTKNTEDIATISRAAVRYFDRLPKKSAAVKRAGAGILHNYASFAFPDVGQASERIRREGLDAGRRALALRTELGDAKGIANARIMLGIQQHRSRRFKAAEREFRAALDVSKRAGATETAWSQVHLARTLAVRGGPERERESKALLASARQALANDPASLEQVDQLLKER